MKESLHQKRSRAGVPYSREIEHSDKNLEQMEKDDAAGQAAVV